MILKWDQPVMIKIGVAIAASYLGIKAPEIFLRNKTVKRKKDSSARIPTPSICC